MQQIKRILLFNTIMGFVDILVKVLELILKEQHIISDLLLLKTILEFICRKVKVLELI
jgi:hypothetical protein